MKLKVLLSSVLETFGTQPSKRRYISHKMHIYDKNVFVDVVLIKVMIYQLIVDEYVVDICVVMQLGRTLLYLAVMYSNVEMVKALIAKGANVDLLDTVSRTGGLRVPAVHLFWNLGET